MSCMIEPTTTTWGNGVIYEQREGVDEGRSRWAAAAGADFENSRRIAQTFARSPSSGQVQPRLRLSIRTLLRNFPIYSGRRQGPEDHRPSIPPPCRAAGPALPAAGPVSEVKWRDEFRLVRFEASLPRRTPRADQGSTTSTRFSNNQSREQLEAGGRPTWLFDALQE